MNNNFKHLVFWKWSISDGGHMERSLRKNRIYPVESIDSTKEIQDTQRQSLSVSDEYTENMAYTQSIQCDSTNWSDSNDIMFLEHQFKLASNNKREESYNKMAEREMVSQIGLNPFLHQNAETETQNSYIQDVINRDLFMKPVNTNVEKPITENDNNNNLY
jgi:hypothetical protein